MGEYGMGNGTATYFYAMAASSIVHSCIVVKLKRV